LHRRAGAVRDAEGRSGREPLAWTSVCDDQPCVSLFQS
jgi:hypothetical protein